MSLISCPLFTLQLKSYCSKIYSALAAAWLVPRLTLTGLLPHHPRAGAVSQTTDTPLLGLSCCWAARQEASWITVMHISALRDPPSREPTSPSPLSDMPAKAGSWCRALGAGISPCRNNLQGLQEGSAWLKVVPVPWHLHQDWVSLPVPPSRAPEMQDLNPSAPGQAQGSWALRASEGFKLQIQPMARALLA